VRLGFYSGLNWSFPGNLALLGLNMPRTASSSNCGFGSHIRKLNHIYFSIFALQIFH